MSVGLAAGQPALDAAESVEPVVHRHQREHATAGSALEEERHCLVCALEEGCCLCVLEGKKGAAFHCGLTIRGD